VSLALPVQVASGTGTANIDFNWDGKNVSGAVCGDMKINENVGGSVIPSKYPVSGPSCSRRRLSRSWPRRSSRSSRST